MRFARARQLKLIAAVSALMLMLGISPSQAQFDGQGSEPGSALSIPSGQLIQPDALNRLLGAQAADKPVVFQVGSHVLFAEAHIPGSKYAGPGSQPAGLELLTSMSAKLSRSQLIVLYCGCCPWNRCPNLEPAFQKLKDAGFTNVKALYIADNFGANWVDKGFPVERGR